MLHDGAELQPAYKFKKDHHTITLN